MRNFLKMKEPVNTWTHFIAFIASIGGLVLLILLTRTSVPKLVAVTIYGTSLITLYGASSLYHWVKTNQRTQSILQKLDHISIYNLIAGTYTPVLSIGLSGAWRSGTLIAVWVLAITGMLLKLWFMGIPRYVSTAFYVILGWFALIPFAQLIHNLPVVVIALMIAGGIFYTLGAIIYATRCFDFFPKRFGFHEIFHLFVVAGSVTHFMMILLIVNM